MADKKELTARLEQHNAAARAILDQVKAENRELTREEEAKVDAIYAEYDATKAALDQLEKRARFQNRLAEHDAFMAASAGRITQGMDPADRLRLSTHGYSPEAADERGPISFEVRCGGLGGRVKVHTVTLQPGTAEHARAQLPYRQAYLNYLLTGTPSAGLQVGSDPKGGYLAPPQFAARVIEAVQDLVFMRQICTVLPPLTSGTTLGAPSIDTLPNDADWTAEIPAADIAEDDSMRFGKRELTPHLMTKLIKISVKLLRAAVLDAEAIVAGRIAYKVAITEEKAFLTGTGAQQALGVFTASADGISTGRDVACAGDTDFTADEIIDWLYNLKAQYMMKAVMLVSREFVKRVRKLKTGDGQYLWIAGLAGQPSTILDRPYYMSEYVPNTFTTGLYIGVCGDFTQYWILDSLNLEIQRLGELFALRNQMGLLARKETDGMPVLEEAFSRLVLA